MMRFLLDEHLRGTLWAAVQTHNAKGINPLEVVRVGDSLDLPLGSTDPAILLWAETNGRLLVSHDYSTMPGHLTKHLLSGQHSPGVLLLRPGVSPGQIVFHLALIAYAGDPAVYQDRFEFIP